LIIKTHFAWDKIPYSLDARYILVIRDPKDVLVSSYFFARDLVFGPMMPTVKSWHGAHLLALTQGWARTRLPCSASNS
jgi:hypothetical protein